MEKHFLAGFARVDITPEESVPLAGYGNTITRMSEKVLDGMYGNCTVITDPEENTLVLIGVDLIASLMFILEPVQDALAAEFGIPKENVFINATHSHSVPDLTCIEVPSILRYREVLPGMLVEGVRQAMADRKPVTGVFAGDVDAPLNHVRHYVREDGTYTGDNFGMFSDSPIADYITKADPTMHLLKLTRESGRDIVLANWRAHATRTGWGKGAPAKNLSADFPWAFRKVLEGQAGCHAVFLQGAAGNINASSRIKGHTVGEDYIEHGAKLAYYAMKGLENNMKPITLAPIRVKQIPLELQCNKPDEELLKNAKKVQAFWKETNDIVATTRFGLEYGIRSPYQANAQVARAELPEKEILPLNAVTLGDWAFVTAPNELFDAISTDAEARSPFPMTMTFGYTNGTRGYIPTDFGFEYTCYESDTTRYARGAGEKIADAFVNALNEMH